ncbi:MAG: hypothetical protein NTU88_12240 [Armatimonadetes bacterium]|nr:hypothetical protein [Armatimonadota bacterium]
MASLGDVHQVAHSFRDKLIEVVHDQSVDEAFFVGELDLVKSIFDRMTGGNCAACIKVFIESEDDEPTLKTLCRDTRSQADRGLMDMSLEFKVSKNTAFNVIMNGGKRWFASNDLTEEGNYLNDTPHFEKHYTSAIVVPIRSKWDNNYYHDGFLAVDSLQPGVFDTDNHPYLLAAIGDLLQPMLSYYRSSLEE